MVHTYLILKRKTEQNRREEKGECSLTEEKRLATLGTGTSVPLGVASRDAKQIGFTRIASRDAKNFSRVPLKLGVSVFWPPRGLRDFRVARRERRISKVWKKLSGRATLNCFFCSRVPAKHFSRRATRKTFFAYPSKSGVENLIFSENGLARSSRRATLVPEPRVYCFIRLNQKTIGNTLRMH